MEFSADPYEQKLYQMFQSCETSQEKTGLLDKIALTRLCQLLQLHDQGSALIKSLISAENPEFKVSFEQFKEALLNFLGAEFQVSASRSGLNSPSRLKENSVAITNDYSNIKSETLPDGESSDREVMPKLIVGTKKYGRRSRPQSNLCGMFVTDSDNTDYTDEDQNNDYNKVQRSSSQSELPDSKGLTTVTDSESKLKRCSSLPSRNLQTKNAFFGGLERKCCVESQEIKPQTNLETISAHKIIEAWELAYVINSERLLHDLGFDEEEINLTHLLKVLEEELRGLEQNAHNNLLRALISIQSMELGLLKQTCRHIQEENLKLSSDNKAASQRVALLVAEVDERHVLLEDNCKQKMNQQEQRHASVVRELTQRLTSDRDHWGSVIAKLETQIEKFKQEDIKLKTDLEVVRTENKDLERENQNAQLQLTELLEKNIMLSNELYINVHKITDNSKNCEQIVTKDNSEYNMLHILEKMTALQMENAQLRDKTDELTIEVENLCIDLARTKSKYKETDSVIVAPPEDPAKCHELETYNIGLATKRRGDSPSKINFTEESPRLGKQPKFLEGAESEDWLGINSEVRHCKKHEEVIATLQQTVVRLERQLHADSDSTMTEGRCRDLENSLEQMQRAYEECEDYWQTKLNEERQMFERERHIYEEEHLENDRKFTELMEKVREYEEQFNTDGRLSPIDERDMLEQQYIELEVEATNFKMNSIRMLEEKSQQISALQCEVEDLRTRLGESVEILTGACDINSDTLNLINTQAIQSPASSPINYLWHQSTIQEPIKTFDETPRENKTKCLAVSSGEPYLYKNNNMKNLRASDTSIFSTTSQKSLLMTPSPTGIDTNECTDLFPPAPISKPRQTPLEAEIVDCDSSSTASNKSLDSNGSDSKIYSLSDKCNSPNGLKDELKRLKFFEISLKEHIKNLSLQRDGLVMELQQLQEARPVLEKAYARTIHPTLQQRLNQLELRNRHLQNVIKQEHKYSESFMQHSWRQHQVDLNQLRARIETQTILIVDQSQRLHNADILVKDLYVENSHLAASVQRLEQQRSRNYLIFQQEKQHLCGTTMSTLTEIS